MGLTRLEITLGIYIVIIVVIGIAIFILPVLLLLRYWRCPHCHKKFALKKIDSTLINKERVSKLETHYNYNKKGQKTSSRKVRVYGTCKTYEITYLCKYCGKETTKIESLDSY